MKNEQGAVIVLVAIYMTIVMGLLALVIDAGSLYLEKSRLQKAVDLAVLAGMQNLPDQPTRALEAAQTTARANELLSNEVTIAIREEGAVLHAEAERLVPFTFAKAIGFSSQVVTASATGRVGSLSGVRGALPLGAYGNQVFKFGERVTLRVGAGGSDIGAFGALQLSGSGAPEYEKDLREGYAGLLSIGDIIETRSGVIAQRTENAISARRAACPYIQQGRTPTHLDHPDNCPLVTIVPIYREVIPNNFSTVQIVGFGSFFIESVGRPNENSPITGRFIRYSFSGDFSPELSPYGAYSYKLVE